MATFLLPPPRENYEYVNLDASDAENSEVVFESDSETNPIAEETTVVPEDTLAPASEAPEETPVVSFPSEAPRSEETAAPTEAPVLLARVLNDATILYSDLSMTQTAAVVNAGSVFTVLEVLDGVLCVEYTDAEQNSIRAYVASSAVEMISADDATNAPTEQEITEAPSTEEPETTESPEPTVEPVGASGSGSFCIMARTQTQLVIPPMFVDYGVGDTILSALGNLNGHSISNLLDGDITVIDGVKADYVRFDEKGGYALDRPASEIQAMVFSESVAVLSSAQLRLMRSMATYLDDADARSSETATAVYNEILNAYLGLTDEESTAWADKLDAAMAGAEIPVGDENAPQLADGVYQITTGGELKWFADLVNGRLTETERNAAANARLVNDISITGMDWSPIGSSEAPYAGAFDGGNHTISGLSIRASSDYQALFGYVGANASVQNLTVSGSVDAGGSYVAGVIAYSEANVSNLHNRCKVTASGQYVAGVVGAAASGCTISGCTNSGSVYSSSASGSAYVGGVVGGKGCTAVDCENSGSVQGYGYVGGVVGHAGKVANCKNSGRVQCVKQYGGGVAGQASSVSGCENSATVTVSGEYITVRARYEGSYIGGVVGSTGSVSNCTNRGAVSSRTSGVVQISSAAGVAGKAGSASDCFNHGKITVSGSYIAGVIGGNGGGTVSKCANFADIVNETTSGEQTGGVASAGKLDQCYNTGSVKGYIAVGGLIGGTSNSSVRNSYNLGSVSGENRVGGLAGVCLSVSDSFNAASVSMEGNKGGLIAAEFSGVQNCYYLDEYKLYSKAGTALDRAALRLSMRANDCFRLNFNEDYHSGYPCLKWEDADTSTAADSVSLSEGVKDSYVMAIGGSLPRLPETVVVTAGGLTFSCAATWRADDGFDVSATGKYAFTPEATLPEGCALNAGTSIQQVFITVMAEDELPQLTAIALEEGTAVEYTTPYGVEPTDFPEYAVAVVDGVQQRVAVRWQAPENLDLTDTSTQFVYTMQLEEAFALAEGVELPTVSLRVLPMMLVDAMCFTQKNSTDSGSYDLEYLGTEQVDGVETFRYRMRIFDSSNSAYLHITPNPAYAEQTVMTYRYTALGASAIEREGTLSYTNANLLSGFVASTRAYVGDNTLTITADAAVNNEETLRQVYVIETCLYPTLSSLQVKYGKSSGYVLPDFSEEWFDYTSQVPADVTSVTVELASKMPAALLARTSLYADGEKLESAASGKYSFDIPIADEWTQAKIDLIYQNEKGEETRSTYQLRIERLKETILSVKLAPETAIFSISNKLVGPAFPGEDGRYSLIRGYEYSYTVSAYGYQAQTGSFTAEEPEMALEFVLVPADSNDSIDEEIPSEWGDFRGDETNNAVTSVATPISASDAVMYWANQAGISYGSDAVSSPILVNGYLICTAKQNIFKIDTVTGEIVQVGDMIKKSAFNITPPTYAKGMLFVALADGTVQAFNADTLESLWVYTDPLGGQPNSPITYHNGYIYTGFWNGERDNGNWVCLSITDENPAKTNEAKKATWTYTQKGGFYWAGAYVSDRFMIVGTDDGETGYVSPSANLLSLDPNSGRVIDCLSGLDADIRCTICYDKKTDRYYFTSKGGYFYSVAVSKDGFFDRDSLKKLNLRNGNAIEGMSTSTPVVYNGRAYVGFSGRAQFQAYSGHGIAVIDLASWTIAYTCPTKGYPQTSGLLTTAYENTGLVYIYFFENMSPGSLRVIRDCPGQTQLLSIYDGSPIDQAEILFTPRGAQRQYALCSPIVDQYGTFYFKNDSGFMMALGSRIVSLEVTEQPACLLYEEGESFDASGMQVVAHLANGCTKDVTQNVSFSQEPLTAGDTDVTIYFNYVRYNNDAETLDRPQTVVNLQVLTQENMRALKDVFEKIDALNSVITADSGSAIAAARSAYDALSVELQELVTNYETLTRAEEEYALAIKAEVQAAEKVDRFIESIGEVTLESADSIRSAQALYDALSDYGKGLVKNYEQLKRIQAQYEALVAASSAKASEVMKMISALGEITLESGDAIRAARDAYDALSDAEKALVTNLSTLEAAEEVYAALLDAEGNSVQQVEELISAIGEVTLKREDRIVRAREAYDALDADAQAKVSNYEKLLEAEETLAALKEQLAGLETVTAQLEELKAQIQSIAASSEAVNTSNAAQLVPLIQQILRTIADQTLQNQSLLADYASFADSYRIAVADYLHIDPNTGVSASGLEWYMQLKIETLTSAGDADYVKYKSLVSPRRIIRLYRVSVIDLLTGEPAANHAEMSLTWVIPTPNYNESSYSSAGIAHVGAASAAEYLESAYTDHRRKLTFSTRGDGLIGFVGTKAGMSAGGSVQGSGSVLDGAKDPGKNNPTGGANDTVPGTMRSYSSVQSTMLTQYGQTVESGIWEYRENVILPALLARFTDAQVSLYAAMSEAVENGTNRFFAYSVTDEEFDAVLQTYRLSNPLSALAEFTFVPEEGVVEVDYVLSEEAHLAAIENWHELVERIVTHALVQGNEVQTAAQLYQYLTETLDFPPEADAEATDAAAEWLPEAGSENAVFYPSAYYALSENIVSENDAASIYAYLLMQVGVECMLIQEAPQAANADAELAETEPSEPHIWAVFALNDQWSHADAEMDIYNRRNPDVEMDVLGHFGMDDALRAESVDAENGYEMVVPSCMLPTDSADTDAENPFIVPECSGRYNRNAVDETVVILDGEGN